MEKANKIKLNTTQEQESGRVTEKVDGGGIDLAWLSHLKNEKSYIHIISHAYPIFNISQQFPTHIDFPLLPIRT